MKKLSQFDAIIERLRATQNYGNVVCRNEAAHDIIMEVASNATLTKRQRNNLVELLKFITKGSINPTPKQ
jgi:hypothetical protein